MENKINIAEILKDCPKGMELDCLMFENVYFDKVSDDKKAYYPILCYITDEKGNRSSISFTKNGCESMRYGAKCVIFPKGKTTWKGFYRPFKDGDVCYVKTKRLFEYIFIFKVSENYDCTTNYVTLSANGLYTDISSVCATNSIKEIRLATPKEKQQLFDAIKANGYKWNDETKTLEKLIGPYFHEGDWITCEELNTAKILSINMDRYEVEFIDGNKGFPHIDYIDRNFHLWTIQDAKDGDILAAYECLVLFKKLDGLNIKCYCTYHFMGHQSFYVDTLQNRDAFHPATKEQCDLLFQKMKEAGYKWNPETKTLEELIKPKFKVGNRVKKKDSNEDIALIIDIADNYYIVETKYGMEVTISMSIQNNYELVPNKFDINTLKPFDKVLVRDSDKKYWGINLFGFYNKKTKEFHCMGNTGVGWNECIPYEVNQHLLGTTDNCDEYFKNW